LDTPGRDGVSSSAYALFQPEGSVFMQAAIPYRESLELPDRLRENLYTAVVADALDEAGERNQAMSERLRPLTTNHVFSGWARTILCMDLHYTPADPYAKEIEAVDSLEPGEVAVVATGQSSRNAPWGELLSTAAVARGARGAVIDGLVRDVKKIEASGLGVFAAGIKPVDSRGRGIVVDYGIPVECGGVLVSPGDLVFADFDGVIVIPRRLVTEIVELATQKASSENRSRADLKAGAYLRDVYERYGVL
jgi:regulator of RNase E activity RraA